MAVIIKQGKRAGSFGAVCEECGGVVRTMGGGPGAEDHTRKTAEFHNRRAHAGKLTIK